MRIVKTAALAAVFAGIATAAVASEADVKFRKANMEVIGGHMHSIVPIVKGEVPHKAQLKAHALGIVAAGKMAPAAFKAEAMEGETTATKDIWANWDKFEGGMNTMTERAQALADAADTDDMAAIGAAVQELGKTCKGCHDNFREKK